MSDERDVIRLNHIRIPLVLYIYSSSSEKLLALFVVLEALLSIDVLFPLVFHVLFSPEIGLSSLSKMSTSLKTLEQ